MNPDAQYVLLLLERSDQQASITGQQVLLDISNMRGVAGARLYGNLTDRQRAASSMYIEPTTWPIVVVFPPHGDRMQRLHWGSWRTSPVMRAVNDYLRKRMLPLVPPTYNRDLESSLWQSLSHDVQLVEGELNGDKMAALREYVGVLAKYYPGEQRVVRKLHQLLHWLWGRNATTLQEFSVKLTGKPDQPHGNDTYISDVVGWVACRGSQPRYRGYTCGLWQMFHSLTVAAEAANRSMNSGLQSSPSSPATDPLEVLHAMRSFVRHFFGCQVCRQNFLNHESVTMETDVHDHEGAMLWMWRVHNSVNRRLSGAFSEDPLSPKVQFPVESACPLCHGKVGWRPGDVLYYLRQMYGAGNIV
ncbi:PREDICTED: sulfhydryl oxidase 1-like [Priapulus caudatus]|uniref:Sulfhydryl oxidase n=1 Tax=Priapulus caudatus TaxID=37621 RepID=A0ABM1FAH7_PRICU|nr:PREDICTED: sulfhydryl oxidase 1-like [Priapulus caudatus]